MGQLTLTLALTRARAAPGCVARGAGTPPAGSRARTPQRPRTAMKSFANREIRVWHFVIENGY